MNVDNGSTSQTFLITKQPEDRSCMAGEVIQFSVETQPPPVKCQWYHEERVLTDSEGYQGSNTQILCIRKCFSRHKGPYKCILTTQSGSEITSTSARLQIGMNIILRLLICSKDRCNYILFNCTYHV